MRVRDVVVGMALGVVMTQGVAPVAAPLAAQSGEAWRTHFAAGEEARQAGDTIAYADEMRSAAEAMPEGLLNRPWVQYHAARAAAMAGRGDEAVRWLSVAWDEGIESLMISFATYDDAFADMVSAEGYREVMGRASGMELEVRPLRGGAYLVEGTGPNVVALVREGAALLVDTGYGPALPALREALAALGAGPIEQVIVTHPHEDHMGATPGLGSEAVIVAHPGTTAHMAEPYALIEGVTLPAKPESARPDVEVSADTVIDFRGERVHIMPTVAHTSGDISVYFEDARVAHLGDTYLPGNPMMYPGTEDPEGFLDALEGFLDAMDPETIVVGGHEEVADVAAVRRQIEESRGAIALVRGALEEGLTMEEAAERGAERYAPQWVAFFYRLYAEEGS